MSSRVLITGGVGFIGSHLCRRLLKEGFDITALDNFSTGKLRNLKDIIDDIHFVFGDIQDYRVVSQAVKNCDAIIHEAFPYSISGMNLDEQHLDTGIIGTFNVLNAAVEAHVQKVVFASSVAVYGLSQSLPIKETDPINPFLLYGTTKYAGELYCNTFSKLYKLETVILRYFYIYGPTYPNYEHSAVMNFVTRAVKGEPLLIYGDGTQVRDYTYIDDAVEGTMLALKKDSCYGEVYNIASGTGISILELAKAVKNIVGEHIEIQFATEKDYKQSDSGIPIGLTTKVDGKWIDERSYVADITKARKELNYNPKFDINSGIMKLIGDL